MAKSRPPYAAEFRNKLVELVRCGRSIPEIAARFEPSEQTIRNGIAQADLELEREILAKAAAWFARQTDKIPNRDSNS